MIRHVFLAILSVLLLSSSSFAVEEDMGTFSALISKLNKEAKLVRLRVDFDNMKFLNREDKVEFWYEQDPVKKCPGTVEAKSNRYLLVYVSKYEQCVTRMQLGVGGHVFVQSTDLSKSVRMAQELIEILLKKRFALDSKKKRFHEGLSIYSEKMEAVNKRYDLLREKLEMEWEQELTKIEEDKTETIKQYKEIEVRLREVELKLEKYRVHDKNLKEDRWSLDPSLYQKK